MGKVDVKHGASSVADMEHVVDILRFNVAKVARQELDNGWTKQPTE